MGKTAKSLSVARRGDAAKHAQAKTAKIQKSKADDDDWLRDELAVGPHGSDDAGDDGSDNDSMESYDEALALPSDEEEDDEDEDGEDDFGNDDAEDAEDAEDVGVSDKAWGSKRSVFYGSDYADVLGEGKQKGKKQRIDPTEEKFRQQELAHEEEKEALRLQRRQVTQLSAEDFGEVAPLPKEPKNKKSKKDQSVVSEHVERDVSKLSKEEQLEVLMQDSPELLEFTSQYTVYLNELQSSLGPLMERVKSGKLQTTGGISYLELRYQLLLSYCLNISFYLMLKAEGRSVRDHPVIDRLVEIRTVIERLKPLEPKLKYQIEKLIRAVDSEDASGAVDSEQSALSHRANVSSLIGTVSDGASSSKKSKHAAAAAVADDDEQGDYNAEDVGDETEVLKYQPPKLAAMHFDDSDGKASKEERRQARLQQKAMRSNVMKEITDEFSIRPREVMDVSGLNRDQTKTDYKVRERQRYEEENYTRLATTKVDKKLDKKRQRLPDELDLLADLGDISALTSAEDMTSSSKRSLRAAIGESERPRQAKFSGDHDDSGPHEKKQKRIPQGDTNELNFSSSSAPKANPFYDEVLRQKEAKKQSKRDAFNSRDLDLGEAPADADGKRSIGYKIEKNRGLTPSRNREKKNPRVKHRLSFKKAVTKRNSQVRAMKEATTTYGGEETGIRTNLSRSVRMK